MFYRGILSERGIEVDRRDALLYAVWKILCNADEQNEFIEWFFSGNWIDSEEELE